MSASAISLDSINLMLGFSGFDAAPLAGVISRFTPIPIPYKEPIDWTRLAVIAIGIIGAALFLHFISPIARNKWSWATVTVLVMLVMTSGFMYSRIRNVPYTGPNGQWIAGGYQNQFGQEVHVVSFICVSPSALSQFITHRNL